MASGVLVFGQLWGLMLFVNEKLSELSTQSAKD